MPAATYAAHNTTTMMINDHHRRWCFSMPMLDVRGASFGASASEMVGIELALAEAGTFCVVDIETCAPSLGLSVSVGMSCVCAGSRVSPDEALVDGLPKVKAEAFIWIDASFGFLK